MKLFFLSLSLVSTPLFSMDLCEGLLSLFLPDLVVTQTENKWEELNLENQIFMPDGQRQSFFYNEVDKRTYFSNFKSLSSFSDDSLSLQELYYSAFKHNLAKIKKLGLIPLSNKLCLLVMTGDKLPDKNLLILSIWDSRLKYPNNFCWLNIHENKQLKTIKFYKDENFKSILVKVLASTKDEKESAKIRGQLNITDENRLLTKEWKIYKRIGNDNSTLH